MPKLRVIALTLVILAMCAAASNGVTANDVLIVGLDEATTTSQCIGHPHSPLCAVETLLACFVRRDLSLCQRVGVESVYFAARSRTETIYRVLSEKTLTLADIPPEQSKFPWKRPGFVEVKILNQTNAGKTKFCPPGCEGIVMSYSVMPANDLWEVHSWSSDIPEPDDDA